jgi:hypothetical protein
MFVSDLRQVGGFLRRDPSTNKADCHNITELLLKVALNIKTLTPIPRTKDVNGIIRN